MAVSECHVCQWVALHRFSFVDCSDWEASWYVGTSVVGCECYHCCGWCYNRQTGNSTFLLDPMDPSGQIEGYRYYSASALAIRPLTIRQLTFRITNFSKVHNQEIRNRIHLAGGKA